MTTVAEIVNLSLRDVGVVGEGQTASGETMADAFTTLNQMLGLWQADGLYVYAHKDVTATLTGAATYTVGVGGAVNVARPIKIDSAYWRSAGVDYPVDVIRSLEEYSRINNKLGGTMPAAICYVPSFPLGTLYVYPNGATGELHLITRTDLPTFVALTDTIIIPPEYITALRYSLGEYLCTTFQSPMRPDLPALASRARRIIKRNSVRIPASQMPSALGRNTFEIGQG